MTLTRNQEKRILLILLAIIAVALVAAVVLLLLTQSGLTELPLSSWYAAVGMARCWPALCCCLAL